MNDAKLLAIAFALSLLTYTSGALITGSPLPFKNLKKLGPTLMKDSIFSMIMIALSSLIVALPVSLYERLGADWRLFDDWIYKRGLVLISWKGGLIAASSLISRVTGELAIESFLEPISKSINYSLLTLYTIFTLSLITRYHYAKLILLGVLLSSVPFKLARLAGCYLIAFSIVFYAGLPLLPVFVETYSSPVEFPNMSDDAMYCAFRILDRRGRPVPYAVVTGYDPESGVVLFRYTSNPSGLAIPKTFIDGVPKRPFAIKVEVFGELVDNVPNLVDLSYYSNYSARFGNRIEVTITLDRVYVLDDNDVYLYDPGSAVLRLEGEPGGVLSVYVKELSPIYLLHPVGCDVAIENAETRQEEYTAYGLMFAKREITAIDYEKPVRLSIGRCEAGPIDVYQPYNVLANLSMGDRLAMTASQIILNFIVLPSVYIAILFTITSSLASLLSGSRGQIPIKLW